MENPQYDLFLGAVMTAVSGTLCTTQNQYICVMQRQREDLSAIPDCFRETVEEFDISRGRVLSIEAAEIFDKLDYAVGGICGIRCWLDGTYVKRIYVLEGARDEFLTEQQFSEQELEWLWQFAQQIQDEAASPVQRYQP